MKAIRRVLGVLATATVLALSAAGAAQAQVQKDYSCDGNVNPAAHGWNYVKAYASTCPNVGGPA
ncbi:hypothetical protein [Streptomyces radicis]|uniref:Secreted protein n=1 Tax=Streptomyces radicis TaxID=1750517 RepID=A0A3A9WEE1_9ACTN|nr:hypothetical protein [Streptomyces radicis]RKN11408.1 hypothetical protein D7319_05525 [Streptomyces radicis]RKN26573.1 hypothetical protein D7318_04135 [Streptomyces radicis]